MRAGAIYRSTAKRSPGTVWARQRVANRSRSAAPGAGQPADPSGRDTETVSEVSETQQSPSSLPLLPAYAQLFGKRLSIGGRRRGSAEIPGQMSVVGEIDEDLAAHTSALEEGHGDEASNHVSASNALSTVDEDRQQLQQTFLLGEASCDQRRCSSPCLAFPVYRHFQALPRCRHRWIVPRVSLVAAA